MYVVFWCFSDEMVDCNAKGVAQNRQEAIVLIFLGVLGALAV